MRHLKTTLAVLGAITILVLAGNAIALATTGHSFILGSNNSANRVTSLSRTTSGTVLTLHSRSNSNAPLSVNGHGKVTNLNADMVDGLDSSALKTTAYVYTENWTSPRKSFTVGIPVPPGHYNVTYSIFLNGAQGGAADCSLYQHPITGPDQIVAEDEFDAGTHAPGVTGAGFVTVTPTQSVRMSCYTTNNDADERAHADRRDTGRHRSGQRHAVGVN
jgi:hypothetical protein